MEVNIINNKSTLDSLLEQAPNSEPLNTYKANIKAITGLIGTSSDALKKKRETTKELLQDSLKIKKKVAKSDYLKYYYIKVATKSQILFCSTIQMIKYPMNIITEIV